MFGGFCNMKTIGIFITVLLLATSLAAACHEMVHVQDDEGNDMVGVNVQLASSCGWGPATDDTDGSGWTVNWAVWDQCLYTASVPNPPEGYTCNTGEDYNTADQGYIYLVCTPDEEVPEFGIIAAIGVLGLAGLFVAKKRN